MNETTDIPRTFSWSRINSYAFCPMLYKHRYIERITPKRKAPALSLGYAMSCGIQKYRQTGVKDDAHASFVEAWEKDGRVLMLKKDEDPRRSVERGLEILSGYVDHYPDEADNIVQPEVAFNIEVANNIVFNGRIDAVIRTIDGSLAIIEDKTTSRLGDTFFTKLKGSSQILWYLWVANKMGLFALDGKNQMPKCWLNAIYIHPKNLRFERDITIKTSQILEQAKDNMLDWIDQILLAERKNLFPINNIDNSQCTAYGGCDYLPLKFVSDSLRARLLESEYMIKENRPI